MHRMYDLHDDTPRELEPDLGLELDAVANWARPGSTVVVADERGLCIELRVKIASGKQVVASGVGDRLRAGVRVSGRAFASGQAQTLVFLVEEVEETGAGRVDGLLRLMEVTARGDERQDPRYDYDAPATAVPAEAFTPVGDVRAAILRVSNVSRNGVAFLADRRFEPGEGLDIAFEDEAGAAIRGRMQVLRAERAVYGRTRYAARILAIGEIDQLRLDRLCNRCRLRDQAAEQDADDDLPLREALVGDRRVGLRRLFGRA